MRQVVILWMALLFDQFFGDPPNRWHPVAWMGSLIGFWRRVAPMEGRLARFLHGIVTIVGSAFGVGLVGREIGRGLRRLPFVVAVPLEALLLKMTFSLRGLAEAAQAVEEPLARGDLGEARRQLGWHLVSRETTELEEAEIAEATIESVAENASDGVVAPFLFYAAGGLPAALVYRFLNTADAMWGYRDADREWLGKGAARLDDLANLVPARVTALLIVVAAKVVGADAAGAWRVWRRDAVQTASPNAGHPMSAMAGALGVTLGKAGQYRLGAENCAPDAGHIRRAILLLRWGGALTMLLVTVLNVVRWRSVSRLFPKLEVIFYAKGE